METNNRHKTSTITFVAVGLVIAIVLASVGIAGADTWTQKADMPTPRWNHSAAVVNGNIYVIGGVASEPSFLNGKELSVVEEYDPATDTWTRKADMPAPRGYLTKSNPVVDGKIYNGPTQAAKRATGAPQADSFRLRRGFGAASASIISPVMSVVNPVHTITCRPGHRTC